MYLAILKPGFFLETTKVCATTLTVSVSTRTIQAGGLGQLVIVVDRYYIVVTYC